MGVNLVCPLCLLAQPRAGCQLRLLWHAAGVAADCRRIVWHAGGKLIRKRRLALRSICKRPAIIWAAQQSAITGLHGQVRVTVYGLALERSCGWYRPGPDFDKRYI